jgi:hypothetical protein
MSAIAPIVINDGQATPVAHTFNPVRSSPDAFYREALSTINILGQGTVSMRLSSDGTLNRVKMSLALPSLETATGANSQGYTAAPKVAYTNTVNFEFILPSRGTAAQRKDLRVLASNLLLNAQIIDALENLNIPY